jgi:hypothetical protein
MIKYGDRGELQKIREASLLLEDARYICVFYAKEEESERKKRKERGENKEELVGEKKLGLGC